jgi:hypothetical protein
MEMVFMERLVRLRYNGLLLCMGLLAACQQPRQQLSPEADLSTPTVAITDSALGMRQGRVWYAANPFSGTVYALHPGGRDTAFIKQYLHGLEHGCWKQFYPSGRLREIRYFGQGQKTGTLTGYWENGQRMLQYHFEQGEYQDTCYEWAANGTLIKKMHYQNGQEAGQQQLFYDNGQIKSNYIIRHGRRYGLLGTKNCINVKEAIPK